MKTQMGFRSVGKKEMMRTVFIEMDLLASHIDSVNEGGNQFHLSLKSSTAHALALLDPSDWPSVKHCSRAHAALIRVTQTIISFAYGKHFKIETNI